MLRDHTEMLEIALVPELLFVAHEMNKAYLLSDTELEEIIAVPSLLTSAQKAGKVVSTVKRMVKVNSTNFKKFVDILKLKSQIFETIIDMLSRAKLECSLLVSSQKLEKVTITSGIIIGVGGLGEWGYYTVEYEEILFGGPYMELQV